MAWRGRYSGVEVLGVAPGSVNIEVFVLCSLQNGRLTTLPKSRAFQRPSLSIDDPSRVLAEEAPEDPPLWACVRGGAGRDRGTACGSTGSPSRAVSERPGCDTGSAFSMATMRNGRDTFPKAIHSFREALGGLLGFLTVPLARAWLRESGAGRPLLAKPSHFCAEMRLASCRK